ncbi:MAG: hypothetical protein IIU03_11985 [Bacteroidales bacterium]|nr:hypothetical protein [Bacteroidales bacterium]MBQ5540941.1 hypothetical protein [Bacteroidales bacterium]MBR4677987.1 hypothetical protein [Bacteroidales bacterium]MEE3448554.1 hypothetical protein [Bacteroidales bacterium]
MKKFLLIIICLLTFYACDKLETYSEQPSVEFKSVYLADTVDVLGNDIKLQNVTLEIIDGDGNLGLNDKDTTGDFAPESSYYNNLFITISEKRNGDYSELQKISENLHYRIPYKAPVGQNKYLKAEVRVKIEIPLGYFDYDTVRYEFYVLDRDLNKSEIAVSCDIPARGHGTVFAGGKCSFFEEEDEETETEN